MTGGTVKPVRTAALAALALAALGLPATGYALASADDAGSPAASHTSKADPAEPDETAETNEPAETTEPADATGDDSGAARPDAASAAGQAHAAAMKAWARCVAQAASGPKSGTRTGPPKLACGVKPMPPGRAKHLAAGTRPYASGGPDARKQERGPKAQGRSHGHSAH